MDDAGGSYERGHAWVYRLVAIIGPLQTTKMPARCHQTSHASSMLQQGTLRGVRKYAGAS